MSGWLDTLIRLQMNAIGFLIAVVVALVAIAELEAAMPWLVVLIVLGLVARVVWTRTRY
ncbi:MAG: hypothetical protein JHC84_05385 [Solirubrobacteraceae bacterium]|nr:hypothetical protein [Solirubrobacteraceae bacterium]